MQSKATTVEQYLAGLPEDRRAAIAAVREVILENLDSEYEEGMAYGMIGYYVPHRVFPAGYHCDPRQPLPFASLASQKNHMAVYLMSACTDGPEGERFRAAWAKTGKKLDMGKSCVRFKRVEDLALDVIGSAIRRLPAREWITYYQKAIASHAPRPRAVTAARTAARTTARPAARKTVATAASSAGRSRSSTTGSAAKAGSRGRASAARTVRKGPGTRSARKGAGRKAR